ncbi:hypothetical protein Dimus_018480 [Dionaea muscipula]
MRWTEIVLVGMLMLVVTPRAPPTAKASDGCMNVIYELIPCMEYMTTGQNATSDCCNAMSAFSASSAANATSLQASCYCMLEIAGSGGINSTYAAQLPAQCAVPFPYAISNQTDCSSLN